MTAPGMAVGLPAVAQEVPVPDDDGVPGAGSLLGPGGVGAVASFLERNQWRLVEARPEQVRATPGRSWTARFQVLAVDAGGQPRRLIVTAEAARRPRELPAAPAGLAARVGLAEPAAALGPYRIWAFPYDPDLSELPDAMSGPAFRHALLGTDLVRGRPLAVSTELLRYRPGRRAVIRYTVLPAGRGRPYKLYGKVLRPHRADRLDAALAALRRPCRRARRSLCLAVPVRLFGGTYVSAAARGEPLRARLLNGGSLPEPRRVADVPAMVADLGMAGRLPAFDERRHPLRLADHAVRLLRHVVPASAGAVGTVLDAVHAGVDAGWAPTHLAHGDLYDDQLFVADDFALGLVDFDDLGPGDPAMDAANCCAHLLALALIFPGARNRLVAYRQLVQHAFLARLELDPVAFAWREGLAVLLLATGPFRVLSPTWPVETARLVELAACLARRS